MAETTNPIPFFHLKSTHPIEQVATSNLSYLFLRLVSRMVISKKTETCAEISFMSPVRRMMCIVLIISLELQWL